MRKKPAFYAILLVAVMALFLGIWLIARPQSSAGDKDLTIEVVHGDLSSRTFAISTSAEYLAEALTENEIVQGEDGPYGLFILTADGETADEANQEWWCFTKGGESMVTGVDDTMIADGDKYEITFTVGW